MKLVIDRFEGKYAVCETEDKNMVNIERSELPDGAREGDVIIQTPAGYRLDKEQTAKRKERINKLIDDIWE